MGALPRKRTVLLAAVLVSMAAGADTAQGQATWKVNPVPVTIIQDDGTAPTQWRSLVGAVVLTNGDVLVGDGAVEVRRFARDGRFLKVEMRKGNGPAELPVLSHLARWRDVAAAMSDREYLLLAIEPPRRGGTPSTGGPPTGEMVAVLSDGSTYTVQTGFKVINPPTRLLHDSVTLVVRAADGTRQSLGRMPSATALLLEVPQAPGGLRYGVLEGAPQLVTTARDSVIWFGASDATTLSRIAVGAPTGDSSRRMDRRSVRLPDNAAAPWTARRLSAWAQWATERAAKDYDKTMATARWSASYLPATSPRWRSLAPDVGGGVWVERFPAMPTDPPEFVVLSSAGSTIGRVRLPRPGRVLDIGMRHVAVAERDDNDVERVVVYALSRP